VAPGKFLNASGIHQINWLAIYEKLGDDEAAMLFNRVQEFLRQFPSHLIRTMFSAFFRHGDQKKLVTWLVFEQ